VVAGHRHSGIAHEVNGIAIVESYSSGRAFGRVDLTVDRATGRAIARRIFPPRDVCAREDEKTGACASASASNTRPVEYEGRPVVASTAIAAILAPAAARAVELQQQPLNGFADTPIGRAGDRESPLGNLQAEWMRAIVPRADVAIANSGGVRADLPAGRITYGQLYEVMPFDNLRVMLTVTGEELRRVVARNLQTTGSVLLMSGIRAAAVCENGQLRVVLQRDSGKPVGDGETLTVVTTDFLASGGDEIFTPVMPVRIEETGPILREEIADWLTRVGGRWRASDLSDQQSRRIAYPGARPVTCRESSQSSLP
jgi:5'-nucleotidase